MPLYEGRRHRLSQKTGLVRFFELAIYVALWAHIGPNTFRRPTIGFATAYYIPIGARPVGMHSSFCEEVKYSESRRSYGRQKDTVGRWRSTKRRLAQHSEGDADEDVLADRIRIDRKFLERNQHWLLFVDDEEAIRQSVGDFLYDSGYQVTACADANAAVEVCRNATSPNLVVSSNNNNNVVSRGPPSCVVADIRMPGGPSGLELLQWIRAQPNPALHRVPVVMLTAKGLTADRIAGYQAGADVYLSKPFYPDELLSVVDNLIARRQEMVGDAGAMVDLQQELTNIQLLLQEQRRTKFQPTDVYLTPAEREVLELLCRGCTNAEIAAERGTTQNYVIKTLQKMYRATGTSTRTELLKWAIQTGYVSPKLP